jgi:hypothetical protein
MQRVECEFEPEVLAAVLQSRWPERADVPLRAHAAACPICSDVAAIAGAIDNAREEMRPLAVVPDSGRVWFLAQLRARREAARAAERPIAAVQKIAAAGAAGVAAACLGAAWDGIRLDVLAQISQHSMPALVVAAALFLAPAAAWLAIRRE